MIDYDATLQKFFQEILLFLNKRMERAKDKHDVMCIMNTADIVRAVAKNPGKYADYNMRVADKLVEDARAFMPNSSDNSAFMIYQRVLNSMGKLNSPYEWERTEAQKVLLEMLKQIKYKNDPSVFKDFYFPFVSATRFAIQQVQKQK
jgi:hypothetical protein